MGGGGRLFLPLAGAYALGVFNDNLYRQGGSLLALGEGRDALQGWILALYTLPFLLVAAPAGWLADRWPKGVVAKWAKGLEVAAMGAGGAGLLLGSWPLVLAMASLMGLQSALFSPALNGAIPELYPEERVAAVNGRLRAVVTAAVLAGVAAAGLALDAGPGSTLLAAAVGAVAVGGFLFSLRLPRGRAAAPGRPFPWAGPLATLLEIRSFARDRLLFLAFLGDAFVWSLGGLVQLQINLLAHKVLSVGTGLTSALVAAELGGVAAGAFLAGRVDMAGRWHRRLPLLAGAMGLAALAVAGGASWLGRPLLLPAVFLALCGLGAAGGAFMVPVEAYIQIRPPADRKGAAVAAANFVVFAGLVAAGPFSARLGRALPPAAGFAVLGLIALAGAGALACGLRRAAGEGPP